jgi:hypothetical protein
MQTEQYKIVQHDAQDDGRVRVYFEAITGPLKGNRIDRIIHPRVAQLLALGRIVDSSFNDQ